MLANERQVGGNHYRQLASASGEQHWDRQWRLHGRGYFIGQITRYAERYHLKNGLEDLDKIIHYTEKLKELEKAWQDGTGPPPGDAGNSPLPMSRYKNFLNPTPAHRDSSRDDPFKAKDEDWVDKPGKCKSCRGTGYHRYGNFLDGTPNFSDSDACGRCRGSGKEPIRKCPEFQPDPDKAVQSLPGGRELVKLLPDDSCACSVADKCPLGRRGMELRCTKMELENNGVATFKPTTTDPQEVPKTDHDEGGATCVKCGKPKTISVSDTCDECREEIMGRRS